MISVVHTGSCTNRNDPLRRRMEWQGTSMPLRLAYEGHMGRVTLKTDERADLASSFELGRV